MSIDDEDIYNEDRFQSRSFPFDRYLTVKGLLRTHYGLEHGDEIYELLFRTAVAAGEDFQDGLKPGILFDDEDGEFVGLEFNEDSEGL